MSNSSESCSPVGSNHVSLCDEDEEGGGAVDDDCWAGNGHSLDRLKVLDPSDQVRELQTIIRDR